MATFEHVSTGRRVQADGAKAARLGGLSSWERVGGSQLDPEPAQETDGGAPPKAGRGSSRDAWASYAEAQGIEVDEEMSRDDIIDMVETS